VSQYATYAEFLVFGSLPETELAGMSLGEAGVVLRLQAASGTANTLLKGEHYTPPFSVWGPELTEAVCTIASYAIRADRIGFNPDGVDANYRLRYNDTIAWLKYVGANGGLFGIVDSTPTVDEKTAGNTAEAFSEPMRNW
jgi:phage gp36-like protein